MKLIVELKSDLCSYSGETFNSFIDTDVVYDEYGFPYIPAKRIKGCIREACLELVEFGVVQESVYKNIFGEGGNKASIFSLDNAKIANYAAMLADIVQEKDAILTHPQRVLSLYTYTRTQTAMEEGVAKPDSLRNMRVVKKGLIFEADLNFSKKATTEQREAFELAASMVKHIGMSRTRGLGMVEVTLVKDDAVQKKNYMKVVALDKEKVRLDYSITLRAPMVCKSDEGNQAASQDYIAGSKVLGMLIGEMGQATYGQLPVDAVLQVSNAYITYGGKRCTKMSKSLQKVKDSVFVKVEETSSLKVYNMINEYKGNEQLTPAGSYYVTPDHYVQTVDMQINYHHRRPSDKSIGRANGLNDSVFYQLESISAGQTFCGFILADAKTAKLLAKTVPTSLITRMGYGRSSEYGMVEFKWLGNKVLAPSKKRVTGDFAIKLNSPIILYNNFGYPSVDRDSIVDYFRELFNDRSLVMTKLFAEYVTIGGYNVTWNARKPMFTTLGAGSVCCFHIDAEVDISLIETAFIGERVREGYGEIEMYPNNGLEVLLRKGITDSALSKKEKMATGIIEELKKKSDLIDLEMRGRALAKDTVETQKLTLKESDVDTIISKLILMFRDEKTLDDFLMQIDAIADEKKRAKAQRIIKSAKESVRGYRGVLTPEEVYHCLVNAYLSQIKYQIRPSRGDRKE